MVRTQDLSYQRQRILRSAATLATLLIAYSNLVALAPDDPGWLSWALIAVNLALAGLLLLWTTRIRGFSLADIGLGRRHAFASACFGLIAGALIAGVAVLGLLAAPLVLGHPIDYGEVRGLSTADLLWRILVKVPLGTALFEEVAFRGVLQTQLLAVMRLPLALLTASAAYGLWHVAINLRTIQDTALATSLPPLVAGQIVQMLGVMVGGVIFGLMRLYTHHIAASTIVHWLTVASLTAALFLVR